MGWYESLVAMLLGRELLNFVLPRESGAVSGEAGTLRLAKGLVRLPDVTFVAADKIRALAKPEAIPPLAPDLAVEVLSKSNTRREIERKTEEYFAAGTRLVWVINPETRTAVVYTSPEHAEPVAADRVLDGASVLPGFALQLGDRFAAADRMAHGQAS